MIRSKQYKASVFALLQASIFLLLTACGGGGGGGGAAPTPKLSFDPVIDGASLNADSADIGIVFDAGVDPNSLSVLLNGIEVEGVFATDSAGATASMFSLSAALKDGANTIEADVANSPSISATFTYDARPEIIHTSYVAGSVNGMVRMVDLQSALLNALSMNVVGKAFALGGVTLPAAGTNVATPDYTITVQDADGDTDTAQFVVPGSNLQSAIAMQFNNGAFAVINDWVGELMGGLDVSSLLPYSYLRGNPLSADVCTVIPGNATNNYNYICDLTVNSVSFGNNTLVDTQVVAGSAGDQKFRVAITATFDQVDIGFKIDAFSNVDPYPQQGTLTSTLSYPNVMFTIYVDVEYVAGKVINFSLPGPIGMVSQAFALQSDKVNVTAYSCNIPTSICSTGQTTLQTNLRLKQDDTIIPALVDAMQDRLPSYIDPALANLSPNDGGRVIVNGPNPIWLGYSGSDAAEVVSGLGTIGGFVSLGASIYADEMDSATFQPVLGSYFDPVDAAIVTNHQLTTTLNHIGLALSENVVNQWLMGVYQSGMLSERTAPVMTVDDLGALGDTLKANSLGVIKGTDPVTITTDLRALPHVRFIAGSSALELVMANLNVNVSINHDDPLSPGNKIDSAMDILVDLKARLNYHLDATTKMPVAAVSAADMVVRVESVGNFTGYAGSAGVTPQMAQSGLTAFLALYVQDASGQALGSSTFSFDLKGLGLQKEAWLILDTLTVDADEQFIVVTASLTSTPPAGGVQALFKVVLTDSTMAPP